MGKEAALGSSLLLPVFSAHLQPLLTTSPSFLLMRLLLLVVHQGLSLAFLSREAPPWAVVVEKYRREQLIVGQCFTVQQACVSYLGQVTVAPGGTDSVASPMTSDRCSDYEGGASLLSSLFLLLDMAALDRGERRGKILRERELGEGASLGLNMTVVLFSRRNVDYHLENQTTGLSPG